MKAKLYARVSSSSQMEGDSIEAQTKRLREFAKEKEYEIVEECIDGGKSASIEEDKILIGIINDDMKISLDLNKRPAFKKLLQDANKKEIDAIIFWKWDRFSRNNIFSKLFQIYFNRYNIKLIPSDDSNDPLMRDIKGALSEEEIRKMKERVRASRLIRFSKGDMVARPPVGYKLNKKKKIIELDLKKADMVKNIFKLASQGTDYKEICKKHEIAPQSYYNIIKNKVYIGLIEFEGIVKKGNQEPLVSEEIFYKLNPNGLPKKEGETNEK